ncbi:lycopene cyclase family protein [Nocardia callitridis]|uniref:lycopene cyclase family protein n=1 Tax=Nocardia callitridis TaxID=648753 RepID=UPI0031E5C295
MIVCGLGPAGRALVHRCVRHGVDVVAIDSAPQRRWAATYAAWRDELPDWLPENVIGARIESPAVWGTRPQRLDREYVVFDNTRLRETLDIDGARVRTGRVLELTATNVELADGTRLSASRVIDARGVARSPVLAEQTAYGLVVDAREYPAQPLFMDWRQDNGADPDAPPSFLYAVPLDADTVLLEETCLVGRPALAPWALRDRLQHRLRVRGIGPADDARVERVRFPVQSQHVGRDRFGAAGGFTHPATGYSVAAALAAADAVATGASACPASARAVHLLRSAGLRALLALAPTELPVFFDAFFALPTDLQRAYLSGRTDPRATAHAMRALFTTLPPALRRRVALATLGLPILSRPRPGSAMME